MDQRSSMFLQFPEIQVGQFVSNLIKCFLFLHEIGKIVCSSPILLGSCTLKKTSSLLSNLNVGKKRLCKYIQENPQELDKWGIRSRVGPLPEDIESQRHFEAGEGSFKRDLILL